MRRKASTFALLNPTDVTREQAEHLGWTAYLRRQSFLAGETLVRQEPDDVWDLLYDVVMEGDATSVGGLDAALPRPQQIELRDLKSGALSGQWPPSMTEDRGLWPLMADLWRPTSLVDAGRSPFYALVALNMPRAVPTCDKERPVVGGAFPEATPGGGADESGCTPGSVRPGPRGRRGDGHPSRTGVAAGLVRSTRGLGRAALERPRRTALLREAAPLDLAPGGVYLAA